MDDERDARPDATDAETAVDGDIEILDIAAVDDAGDSPAGAVGRATAGTTAAHEEAGADEGSATELAVLKDRHLRMLADFDNFRKRADRERDERVRQVLSESLRQVLPVVDNLERALASSGSLEDLRLGVEMTERQFGETLRRLGVEEVPGAGSPFDPRDHEAVSRVEAPEVAVPTVVEVFQRGYRLGGRLLRPAMVRVAVPPEPAPAAGDESS